MSRRFQRALLVGFAFCVVLAIILSFRLHLQADDQRLPAEPEYVKEGHPKMESILYQLMKISLTEGMEKAKEFAQLRQIDMENDRVRVTISAQVEGADETGIQEIVGHLKLQIENVRGKIEVARGRLIQSLLPLRSLQVLADLSSVKYISLPVKPKLLVTSEGVSRTGADRWHSFFPYHSEGAKVCILDLGFKGYKDLLGKELPDSIVARSFRSDQDISANEVHGTACAEIVHDMAPNAELWLVNFGTSLEMLDAVDWIIDQGVHVISASFGLTMGPMDGTGLGCEGVKKAHDGGIVWINAAGNEAEKHWAGTFSDPDGNGYHNFSGSDELLEFFVPAYYSFEVKVRWDDWGTWNGSVYSGSGQDYDLRLYMLNDGYYQLIAKSENYQTGYQWPIEGFSNYYANISTKWAIAIKKYIATRTVKFDCFIDPVYVPPIEYSVPAGSLASPGDSPYAITVGAVDWQDDSYAVYSSQGPTTDGRTKPDLCAPTRVSTVSYGTAAFTGTSSACPHVAGAFALLKSLTPYSLDQIKDIIDARAVDLGASGKDNKFGLGRLSLSKKSSSTREIKHSSDKLN